MSDPSDVLEQIPAPKALRHSVLSAVSRRNGRGGAVVVELPETRSSIQMFLADAYWLRERDAAHWRRVPADGLWGPRLSWGYGYAEPHIEVFALGLTPQGVTLLTGRSPAAFIDDVVPLAALNRPFAGALREIVARHATFAARAAAAFNAVSTLLPAEDKPARIIDALEAIAAAEQCSISKAAARLKLSERQFRRLFREQYGVAPKLYQRALRLDRALKSLHPRPWEANRPDESIDYADQSHMIREFLALTGLTPQTYVRNKQRSGDPLLRSVAVEGIAPPPLAVGRRASPKT